MKRVALINGLSGLGKCSLTAAIPVISVMGIQACPLPTAILTAQTGFGNFFVMFIQIEWVILRKNGKRWKYPLTGFIRDILPVLYK